MSYLDEPADYSRLQKQSKSLKNCFVELALLYLVFKFRAFIVMISWYSFTFKGPEQASVVAHDNYNFGILRRENNGLR